MKHLHKSRVLIGGAISVLVTGLGVVAGQPQAVAPVKAEAVVISKSTVRMNTLAKYSNADSLTDRDLVKLLDAVGFEGKALRQAWAIAKKESTGRPLAHNGNRDTGDNSYGLFQINMLGSLGEERRDKFSLGSNAELLNPVVNAKVAYHMSDAGQDWSAWKGTNTKRVKYWLSKFPKA